MSTLDGPGFRQDGPSLGSLKTAEEVAKVVRLSLDRILELSRAEVLPHFRIDGGEPLFSVPTLKAYVRRYLTVECEGAPLPLDLRPVVLKPVHTSAPLALTMVQDRLCECPAIDVPPCVYFLIDRETILYVGQSCNLPARLVQHSQAGRQWERALFLPVPESELLQVEAHWIRALKPSWNRCRTAKPQSNEP
ncbi:MAG: hypothetical protein A4E19_05990 [Nitrospira sp. SG-bin1]|nr:MAG: hypothetical protein A4E19_05990 [Nitrospira sp. SG-bin1]